MAFYGQCNLQLQDCNSLWPRSTSQQAPFTNQSCVQDVRLTGNIGRCGWAGAPCTVNGTVSNCIWPYAEVCQNGVCVAGVGEPCVPFGDRYTCNVPVYCNVTIGHGPNAICGGLGAAVNVDDKSKGLDFGRDYCVSGNATQSTTSPDYWTCNPGDAHIATTPTSTNTPSSTKTPVSGPPNSSPDSTSVTTTKKRSTLIGPIVGAVIGGLLIILILAFFWYRRRERRRKRFRVDAYDPADPQQEPLHRRQLSEQSHVTTTSETHKSPIPEMRTAAIGPSGKFDPLINGSVVSPTTRTESSDIHTPQSHLVHPQPGIHRTPSLPNSPVAASAFVASSVSLSQEMPGTPQVTRPARARTRLKSAGSTSSRPGTRGNSVPRTPDSVPVSSGDVEQRLLELRDEAERGLAEIRAKRTGSDSGEMPPPYNV